MQDKKKFQEEIDTYIKKEVANILVKAKATSEIPDTSNYIETDNFAEVLDKLIIVHIRCWMLEDLIHKDISDEELGKIKRKIDICFKKQRPKLVEALNRLVDKAVLEGKYLAEESVKIYK